MNIAEMRTRVRHDLRDDDPAARRWSDEELDRHVQHAVHDLSGAAPVEAITALAAVAGSREVPLSALDGLIDVEAVEYPIDQVPASFVPFSRWGASLTLHAGALPAGGEQLRLWHTRGHTLDAASSTIPEGLEDAVALGAAAYAALAWASFAANRVNLGGEDTARRYRLWGNERLDAFRRALGRAAARRGVRVRRMYPEGDPAPRHLRVRGA